MAIEIGDLIQACREAFGSPPRRLSEAERDAFRIRPTLFIRAFLLFRWDRHRKILRDQDTLRDFGNVVWGYVVQANRRLFSPTNRWTLPAVMIYGIDPYFDNALPLFEAVASDLLDLRGMIPREKQ
ncbi:MAG: hypothetical protein ABFC96_18335 [Thermoguttaceae bacterium]